MKGIRWWWKRTPPLEEASHAEGGQPRRRYAFDLDTPMEEVERFLEYERKRLRRQRDKRR
jgi:hypothetical protein